MWPFRLVLLLFSAVFTFYIYRFLHRSLQTFGVKTSAVSTRLLLGILSACLGGAFMTLPGLPSIIVLHLAAVIAVFQLINRIIRKLAGQKYGAGFSFWKKLYGSGIVPIVLTAAVIVFGYCNMHHVVQTNYTIYTHKDIRPEGYRVALIADVHYGISLDYDELTDICDEVSSLNPDLVILCGDIVDNNSSKEEMYTVFQALGTIESKFGSYYVYGNHDRPMALVESVCTEAELNEAIVSNGITILKDETRVISNDFTLAGREDRGYGAGGMRMSIGSLLQNVDPDSFILTLDHQPNEYEQNGAAGTDLLLSGHTHGGQLWPVNVLDNLLKFNDANYGHTQIDADTQAIVTSGFAGWGWPIKTAAPAEYVIIDIQKGA